MQQQFRFWGTVDPRGRQKAPIVAAVPASGGDADEACLLYTSDAADDLLWVDLCGRLLMIK